MADCTYLLEHPRALLFKYLAIKDAEEEQHMWAEKMLGVRLSAEQIHTWAGSAVMPKADGSAKPESLYIPMLSALKDREYFKHISGSVSVPHNAAPPIVAMGDYSPDPNEKIISMADADKTKWMNFISTTGIYDPDVMRKAQERAKAAPTGQPDINPSFQDTTSKEEHLTIVDSALGPTRSKKDP